jgi:hypothetical protein
MSFSPDSPGDIDTNKPGESCFRVSLISANISYWMAYGYFVPLQSSVQPISG